MPFTGRVLLVGPLEGARWRSISHYTATLADALRAHGIAVETVAAPWFNPPSLARGIRAQWARQPAVQAALHGEFDVVHLTDQALAHHVHRFQPHAPVVVTCHDLMPFTLPGYYHSRLEGIVKRAFLRRPIGALHQADAVIAVSNYTAGAIAERRAAPAGRVHVIPNMVRPIFRPMPVDDARSLLAARGVTLPPRPRVLSLGHAGGYKNLPLLIRAMAEPPLRHASLVRVGSLRPEQQALAAQLGVADRVTLLVGIEDEALAALMNACDSLAQPSLAEGFGLPVVEAFACGLPVVTSDGGALPEVVGDAGTIVAIRDNTDACSLLAAALAESFANEGARARGLARAMEFRPGAVVPQLVGLYEQISRRRVAQTPSAR